LVLVKFCGYIPQVGVGNSTFQRALVALCFLCAPGWFTHVPLKVCTSLSAKGTCHPRATENQQLDVVFSWTWLSPYFFHGVCCFSLHQHFVVPTALPTLAVPMDSCTATHTEGISGRLQNILHAQVLFSCFFANMAI